MGKINVLSFAVANLIAAGEVVDRPASVIKELMENAIDAGARHITVEIRNGGVTFMRVADDGCGISPEDLPVAIRRHATSKIKEADDLDGILTLGFRGEALAAIAAVSDLRIITRTADAPFGSLLVSRGGEVESITEQGAPVGTTVIVENLFGNVPARRKFLKKDVSEAIAVGTYVEKIALSRPDIAIRLISDGNMKLDTAGDGKVESAMYAVFGREFVSKMIKLPYTGDTVKISGYISRPDNVRAKRNYENFFINGRYINCRTASAALEQAYTSYIPPEKFPCCVMYIEVNPEAVDVNVHPAKLEVKFSNEKPVFDAVYYTVRGALDADEARPALELKLKNTPTAAHAFAPVEEGKKESLKARQTNIFTVSEEEIKAEEKRQATRMERMFNQTGKAYTHISAAAFSDFYKPTMKQPDQPLPPQKQEFVQYPIPFPKVPELEEYMKDPPPSTPRTFPEPEPKPRPMILEEDGTVHPVRKWRMVGQVFHAYIVVENGDKMLLIDQHAAHERVLFEQMKAALKRERYPGQLLIVPILLNLAAEDRETLMLYAKEVDALGFGMALTEEGIAITEIPAKFKAEQVSDFMETLAVQLREGTGDAALTRDLLFEKALYQGACKAAIKAGREYPPEYLQWLCDQLESIPDITVCPHGRPVAMELTHSYIDKQFKRG